MIWWYIFYAILAFSALILVAGLVILARRFIIIKLSKEDTFLEEGLNQFNRQYYKEAIEKYHQALEIKKDCPDAYYGIAKCHEAMGQLDKAMEFYERTITVQERYPAAYHGIGWILHQKGKLDEAIIYYSKAVSQNRKLLESHINIGAIYFQQGKIRQALEKFDDAMFLDPKYTNAYTSTIDVLFILEAYEDIITVADNLLKKVPNSIDAYFSKAVSYYFLEEPEMLEKMKHTVEELNPIAYKDLIEYLAKLKQTVPVVNRKERLKTREQAKKEILRRKKERAEADKKLENLEKERVEKEDAQKEGDALQKQVDQILNQDESKKGKSWDF